MNKKLKKLAKRIVVSLVIFIIGLLIPNDLLSLGLLIIAYMIVGYDVVKKAIRNIKNGQVFDENFLMMIATFGAFITNEYPEAVMVMWLYQVGELFQGYAVGKSRASISSLMEIAPEYANVYVGGELVEVDPDEVELNSIIVVKTGEKVPLDGVVVKGSATIDTSALTGESIPRNVKSDDEVISGSINLNGLIEVCVTKTYENSTVTKILELVENASSKKAKTENFITKFARYYTPIVVILALILAIVPPLLFGGNWFDYMKRACSFLVISCPCALVISVPMGFFGGIGAASREGILVKGGNYIELLSKLNTMVFDKTGTLTNANFKVSKIDSKNLSNEEFIEIAAHLEMYSNHPIANAIKDCYKGKMGNDLVEDYQEIAGQGIIATYNGKKYCLGNAKLLNNCLNFKTSDEVGTIVYLACENNYLGYLLIEDEVKDNAKKVIEDLKHKHINTVMLSGDKLNIATKVAKYLGIDKVYAELLPQDKVAKIEELLKNNLKNKTLAFVGDGINDAPVLMRADVGFAMGALGSDAAIEAADIVIMDDKLEKLPRAISIAKKTMAIVYQNIIFALGVKFAVLALGAFGYVNMWIAVFADVGVAFIAIMNSMRTLTSKM